MSIADRKFRRGKKAWPFASRCKSPTAQLPTRKPRQQSILRWRSCAGSSASRYARSRRLMSWPDILVLALVALAALKGFKRGFIRELSGAVALVVGLAVPWFYNGAFDRIVENTTHLG